MSNQLQDEKKVVGITPDDFAKIWDDEADAPRTDPTDWTDAEVKMTPVFKMHLEIMSVTVRKKKILAPDSACIPAARSSLQEAYTTYVGFVAGDSALPVFAAAESLGLVHGGLIRCFTFSAPAQEEEEAEEVYAERVSAARVEWLAALPIGSLHGTKAIKLCFENAIKAGIEHDGEITLKVRLEGEEKIGSIELPTKATIRKPRTASGKPREKKFVWDDYLKLAGYGEPEGSEADQASQHEGFMVSVKRGKKANAVLDLYELVIEKDGGKGTLTIHSYPADKSKRAATRMVQGMKKDALTKTEEVEEVNTFTKMCEVAGIGGNRTPAGVWNLRAKLEAMEAQAAAAAAEAAAAAAAAAAAPEGTKASDLTDDA